MEAHVKELLRRDGIKLWLPPYTVDGRESGSYPTDMLVKYGRETGRSPAETERCLEKIRKHAVARLEANKKFSETGVATLYVSKVLSPGSTTPAANSSAAVTSCDNGSTSAEDEEQIPPETSGDQATIECKLLVLGHELRGLVASALSIPRDEFRMIAQARLIEDNCQLNSQGVAHGMDVLCIVMTEEERRTLREQSWMTSADRTRDAVKSLMKNQNADDFAYIQIADQKGNPIQMPREERVALALAIALHEKGRKALKLRQYGQALLYFLEADKEFDLCPVDILKLVDNYAILCLDIVWCYLRLQRVHSLPDAERRLQLADVGFRKSYGPNFERLAKIRQGIMHEKALIVRLKLLQGALAYYQRRYRHAHEYFASVSREIKALEVDDAAMSQIVAMGYSASEARIGLRASGGSIEAAVHHIIGERDAEAEREKQREHEYREQMMVKRFGATPTGKPIDIGLYDQVVEMGFSKRAAGEALRQADNDMNAALEILRLRPHQQSPGDDLIDAVEDILFDQHDALSTEDLIRYISSLGFPAEMVAESLRLHPNDFVGAVEALLSSGGSSSFQALLEANPQLRSAVMRVAHELQAHQSRYTRHRSRGSTSQRQQSQSPGRNAAGSTGQQQALLDEETAFKQLQEDVSNNLHDHFDTTFEEELQVLEMLQPLAVAHLK